MRHLAFIILQMCLYIACPVMSSRISNTRVSDAGTAVRPRHFADHDAARLVHLIEQETELGVRFGDLDLWQMGKTLGFTRIA